MIAGYSETKYPDYEVLTAAGMLEGYLTQKYTVYSAWLVLLYLCICREIYNMYTSMSNETFKGHSSEYMNKVKEFYVEQVFYTLEM